MKRMPYYDTDIRKVAKKCLEQNQQIPALIDSLSVAIQDAIERWLEEQGL